MSKPIPLLVTVAFVVAGCLNPTNSPPEDDNANPNPTPFQLFAPFTVPKPDYDFSTMIDPDHAAHNVPALHTDGHGLALEGFTPIQDILPPGTRGSITQIDVFDGYALVSGMENGPAFVIVDTTDPTQPRPVSFAPTVADGWSARFSKDDGDYVFYGCQIVGSAANPDPYVKGNCRDPNAGPSTNGDTALPASALNVYDVTDKSNPRFVDSLPANGTHNIQTVKIDGIDYITTATTEIIKFDRENQRLEHVVYLPGQHDSTVGRHPITGDWLLITGRSGSFVIYNISDPYEPEVILEPGAFASDGWHEQVMFPQLVDGRALLAVAGEAGVSPTGGVGSKVTFIDITNPAKPVKLSEWRPPFAPIAPWAEYAYSVHEGAATPQGQFAIAWYHGGVWVLDVSTKERQTNPEIVAAYQPHEMITAVPSTFAQTPVPYVPFVWSAAWDQRGYLAIPDMHTGVYLLEPSWGLIPMRDGGA